MQNNKTLKAYNNNAEIFDAKFSVYEPYIRQMKKFSACFGKPATILDAGCGSGLNAQILSGDGHTVTGFDFSEAMIALAKKNCPKGSFSVSTLQEFESPGTFDGLCLSFILVHLTDREAIALFDKFLPLVNTDGYVYVSFMTGKKSGYETTSFSDSEIFFNYFNKEKMIDEIRYRGFQLESEQTEPYPESNGTTTEDLFLIFKKVQ